MSTTSIDPGSKSAGQIETEVEQTRASVSGTLDALRGKLEPRQIVDQVVEQIADYARGSGGADFVRNLGASVRDNPLPVVLIGAGIGWLLLAKSGEASANHTAVPRRLTMDDTDSRLTRPAPPHRDFAPGAGHDARGSVEKVKDAVGGAVSSAAATVTGAASQIAEAGSSALSQVTGAASAGVRGSRALGDQAMHAAHAVGDGVDAMASHASSAARRAADRLGDLAEDQPLLLGILGMALGAAVGAALPRTRTEDRLLGDTRDAVVGRLSEATSEGYEEIRTVAGEQVDQLKDAVGETYEKTKAELDEKGFAGTGSALGNAASGVAQAVGSAVDNLASHVARKADEVVPPKTEADDRPGGQPQRP